MTEPSAERDWNAWITWYLDQDAEQNHGLDRSAPSHNSDTHTLTAVSAMDAYVGSPLPLGHSYSQSSTMIPQDFQFTQEYTDTSPSQPMVHASNPSYMREIGTSQESPQGDSHLQELREDLKSAPLSSQVPSSPNIRAGRSRTLSGLPNRRPSGGGVCRRRPPTILPASARTNIRPAVAPELRLASQTVPHIVESNSPPTSPHIHHDDTPSYERGIHTKKDLAGNTVVKCSLTACSGTKRVTEEISFKTRRAALEKVFADTDDCERALLNMGLKREDFFWTCETSEDPDILTSHIIGHVSDYCRRAKTCYNHARKDQQGKSASTPKVEQGTRGRLLLPKPS